MINHQHEVEALAYSLWESRGRPEGSSEDDWHAAEQLLLLSSPSAANSKVDEASKESFPASDAPGSHLPDRPPSNADQKWAASAAAKAGKPSPSK